MSSLKGKVPIPFMTSCSFAANAAWEIVHWKEGNHRSMRKNRSNSEKTAFFISSSSEPKLKWNESPDGINAAVTAFINVAK